LGPARLRPSVALWSLAVLCLASLGIAALYSIISFDGESGRLVLLSVASVLLLAATSIALASMKAMPFFLSSGALTMLLALSSYSIEGIGLVGSWGAFFLCLYAILLGGKVVETGKAIDLRSAGWTEGDPMVARSIWREGLRVTALLGATFLLAFLLLSVGGLLVLGDLSLLFLALLSVLVLVMLYTIAAKDSWSER
jgi:hypothetical protein